MAKARRNRLYPRGYPSYQRPIQPKHPYAQRIVYRIAVTRAGNLTNIFILPNEIKIKAKDLITMINEKQEYITAGSGDNNVRRQDLLLATEALLEQHQGERAADPQDNEDMCWSTTSIQSPSSERIRRPANAFMIYASVMRKRVRSLFPEYSNQEVSKLLGALWRTASNDIKTKYQKIAEEERLLHKQLYPSFDYHGGGKQHDNTEHDQQQGGPSSLLSDPFSHAIGSDPSSAGTTVNQYAPQHFIAPSLDSSQACSSDYPFPTDPGAADDVFLSSDVLEALRPTSPNPEESEWQDIVNMIATIYPDFSPTHLLMGETNLPMSDAPATTTDAAVFNSDTWDLQREGSARGSSSHHHL